MLKNRLVILVLMLIMAAPVIAETPVLPEEIQSQELVQEPVINTVNYKQPVSKRKIAKKFLMAMGGVAVSSILLFVMLSLYNKIRDKVLMPETPDNETSLVTPDNQTDAVRVFLEKTKWDD